MNRRTTLLAGIAVLLTLSRASSFAAPPPKHEPLTLAVTMTNDPASNQIKVYDAFGRFAQTLVEGWQNSGLHSVVFDASTLPTGVYFYRITSGNRTQITKAIVRR